MSQPKARPRRKVPRVMRYKPQYIVVVTDTHFGCRLAPCLRSGFIKNSNERLQPTDFQNKLNDRWDFFWEVFVPSKTHGKPFIFVHVGDVVDGDHHGARTIMSHDMHDQREHAIAMLKPIVDRSTAYYQLAGTEAHSGINHCDENTVAKTLGARRDEYNRYCPYELTLRLNAGRTAHFTHHQKRPISAARVISDDFIRSGSQICDYHIGGHLHHSNVAVIPRHNGDAFIVTLPAWQAKGPFGYKVAAEWTPQIGGAVIEIDEFGDALYPMVKKWNIERPSSIPVLFNPKKELAGNE